MSGIFWLASYPKSGNTWLRIFLSNYHSNADTPVDINDLDTSEMSGSRYLFDESTGIDSGDLTFEEVDNYRPRVYTHFAQSSDEQLFCKIHDAYTYLSDGCPLIPTEATLGAIYIIRNPFDVAVSSSSHNDISIDSAVQTMADNDHGLACDIFAQQRQLRQKLLTWGNHVRSWTEKPDFPVLTIRYEDMLEKPEETFIKVIHFIGDDEDPDRIRRAIRFSSFEEVRNQEEEKGFLEKPTNSSRFFRSGKAGAWRDVLNEEQVKQIIDSHQEIMRAFGYLTANNEIVY